jgi:hypothetical protein
MRELFQGEPPIQYKEGVEEYIRHHSGERAIADELILKTISRVFNLNFMIVSSSLIWVPSGKRWYSIPGGSPSGYIPARRSLGSMELVGVKRVAGGVQTP